MHKKREEGRGEAETDRLKREVGEGAEVGRLKSTVRESTHSIELHRLVPANSPNKSNKITSFSV